MNEPLGYSCDGDTVTLRMTRHDYENLLLALGYASGATPPANRELFWRWIALVNRLNVGNEQYVPYKIPEGAEP